MSGAGLFLGVDGGGSKTELVLIDEIERVVSRGLIGSTYHLQIGVAGVASRLAEGIAALLSPLGLEAEAVTHAFFGLPAFGEDGVADPQLVTACAELLKHDRFTCDNDMVCGWAGSLALADGINLVAGTGSIAYGECEGRKGRAGGWGEVFGDEGSGYWIAMRGLQAFARMSDGRAPVGPLHHIISEQLGLRHNLELCEHIMSSVEPCRERVAALAPLVTRAAAEEDAAAMKILVEAGEELASLAVALRHRLGFRAGQPVPLTWSGSILSNVHAVRNAMLDSFRTDEPFMIETSRHSPAFGAALLAKRAAGCCQSNVTGQEGG